MSDTPSPIAAHAKLLLIVAAVVLVLWYARGYLKEATQKAVAEAATKLDAQHQKELDAQLRQRDQDWQKQRDDDQKRFASATTPQQMAAILAQLVGGKPPVIVLPQQSPATPAAPANASTPIPQAIPDSPGYVRMPTEQFAATVHAVEAGSICSQDLVKCNADAVDWKKKFEDMQADRDRQKEALKGGTLKHRFAQGLKCLAVSSAAAGLGAAVDKQHPAVGAAIGGGAGNAACQVFF